MPGDVGQYQASCFAAAAKGDIMDISTPCRCLVGLAPDPDIKAGGADRALSGMVAAPDFHALHGVSCVCWRVSGGRSHRVIIQFLILPNGCFGWNRS